MLVPTPRNIKEMRKNAASTMDNNFTQKPILSRFIIMAGYPPRSSPTEAIVYHVATDDRGRNPPASRSFENIPPGVFILGRGLDHGKIGPFPRIERPCLGLDTERARPTERRKLEARLAAHTVQLHREQRLLEEVHARTAPEPVGTHADPDATADHGRHGRDTAPEVGVQTGTVSRRRACPRQNPYVLLGDSCRQVRGYGLWGEELYALRVADGGDSCTTPLVAAEDVGEAARTTPYELDLLGTLGEVDRKRPPHLPGSLTRQFTRSGRPSPSSRAFAIMNSTASSEVPISCGKNSAKTVPASPLSASCGRHSP